jgi:plastocyanin
VIVGRATADTSIYANAFFPQAIEIGVGDTVTWTFEGVHNVAFLGGGAAPPFSVLEGDKMYWNPLILFPEGDNTYDGTGYHTSGMPGPDGRLSYTLTFTKPGRYSYTGGERSKKPRSGTRCRASGSVSRGEWI